MKRSSRLQRLGLLKMALIQLDRFLQLARKESPAKYRNRSDLLLDDRTKGIFNTRQQAQR